MLDRTVGMLNRYNPWSRIVFYGVALFVGLQFIRAAVNCGPWLHEDVRKSCVINQPRRPIIVGEVEEIKPLPLFRPEIKKPQEELINIRMTTGTLTVNPVVRDGPGNQFSRISRIRPGDVVEIVEEEDDWIKLRMLEPTMDDWTGWVRGRFREDQPESKSGNREDIID